MQFNVENFLNTTVNEANSTELLQVPEGEYVAVSEPITAESFKEIDITKGERAGQKGLMLNVGWLINDETGALKTMLGRPPKVVQRLFIDVRQDGSLEFGKGRNVDLGRLREALGQNLTGKPFQFGNLGNQVAKIKVKNDIYQGKTQANVVGVTKA